MEKQIIQKYIDLTSQNIYNYFLLETQLEEANKKITENEKELERLKKILDENGISYEEKELEDEARND